MMTRVCFKNGDYVLLGEKQHLYYRKHYAPRGKCTYTVTTITPETLLGCTPKAIALREAVTTARSSDRNKIKVPDIFFPKIMEPIYTPDGSLETVDHSSCPITCQTLVRFKALSDLVFSHPVHSEAEDRVYKVKAGTVSGWMPEYCGNQNVWVDEGSMLSGYAENVLVTGNSNVVNSHVTRVWARSSTIVDSNVFNSVVQKSNVDDCDLDDCGVRRTAMVEVTAKKSSFIDSTAGVSWFRGSQNIKATAMLVVVTDSIVQESEINCSSIVESKITFSTVKNSFVTNHLIESSHVIQSKLADNGTTTHKEHVMIIMNNNRNGGKITKIERVGK